MSGFRPNVAALVMDPAGKLLICERLRIPGAWQFPQGGVDQGETAEQAVVRELAEEVGLGPTQYELGESRGGYRYVFPPEVSGKKSWKYKGQEQTYFVCRLREVGPKLDLSGPPREFRQVKWIDPSEFRLDWLPEFKHEVYRAVMRDFFGVEL